MKQGRTTLQIFLTSVVGAAATQDHKDYHQRLKKRKRANESGSSAAPFRGKHKGDIVHMEGDPAGSNVRVIDSVRAQVEFKKPAKDTVKNAGRG